MTGSVDYRQNWADYLRHMMAGRSQADFARAIGSTEGQLSKWLSGTTGVTAERVIAIARALGDNPPHALARVGWLSVADIAPFRAPRQYGLDEYEDREIAMEIVRRIDNGENHYWLTHPTDVGAAPQDIGRQSDHDLAARERSRDRGEGDYDA